MSRITPYDPPLKGALRSLFLFGFLAKGLHPWRMQGIQTYPYGLPAFGASLHLPPSSSPEGQGCAHTPFPI